MRPVSLLLFISLGFGCLRLCARENETVSGVQARQVPGVIVDHVPASSGLYIGSPSIAILTNGDYLMSHDYFGPKSGEFELARSAIFLSTDRGATWSKTCEIQGAFWSTLFVHHGAVYLLGTDRHHGNVVIRGSLDGGKSWTSPVDSSQGLLTTNSQYHCAPVPVVEHNGRLWRGMERRDPPVGWGSNYGAGMLSVPMDADLLVASNWTFSTFVPSNRSWNSGDMEAWLEGNAVVGPNGNLVDFLRVQTKSPNEKAAMLIISSDGKSGRFDPTTGFIDFPGGSKKFTIRYDPKSQHYWTLTSVVLPQFRSENPSAIRNTLALLSSTNLQDWQNRGIVLHHPDMVHHAFQYVDWLIDGDDIIAACRTAFDDSQGGAHSAHDANFLTFHRIANFRSRSPGQRNADSAGN